MNKKLLFVTMSLAALTACTNDDFESKNVAQEVSPVQFEVLNNDAITRASMDGNTIKWSAKNGDLFTLYHGAALGVNANHENATYKANASEGAAATLTTPSMIKTGGAIMVWPVDTTFRYTADGKVAISIPTELTNIENNIPYVSDEINISAYGTGYNGTHNNAITGATESNSLNTAGKDRKYPVFMRPMASQLIVKADYNGSDATLAQLYENGSACPEVGDGVLPISVTNIDLLTRNGGATQFTTKIALKFTATNALAPVSPTAILGDDLKDQWATVANSAWNNVTDFDMAGIMAQTGKLSAMDKCLDGTDGCKFLILPQAAIAGGVLDGGVLVNTLYGRVVIANTATNYPSPIYAPSVADPVTGNTGATSAYTAAEYADAWYRYISAASKTAGPGVGYDATETPAADAGADGKFKTTANIANGLMQTINGFSTYKAQSGIIKYEPVGAAATRYVKVLLDHLDMSDLHIKNDKHLRDAARVWNHLGLPSVTVLLDNEGDGEFEMSQKTIQVINKINADIIAAGGARQFTVMPCNIVHTGTTVSCGTIRITGGGNVPDLTFIKANSTTGYKASVALKAGENWKWSASVNAAGNLTNTVRVPAAGVASIINRGTFTSDATATIKTAEANDAQNNVLFVNNGIWNVSSATLNVQFSVTNNATLNIAKGAQYRQDGNAGATVFNNEAATLPYDFIKPTAQSIGTVNNEGVFATVKNGTINNYGLIEHADPDAKTYVTTNQTGAANFANAYSNATPNKMGRINLPYSNKEEDNISISAAANSGFVSVTVTASDAPANGILDASVVGARVNYICVKGGIQTISAVSSQVKYLEVNQPGTEIAWNVVTDDNSGALLPGAVVPQFNGMMILSDVNIKLNTRINVINSVFLGADMYVGGKLLYNGAQVTDGTAAAFWNGYFGNTSGNYATKYITY